MVKVNNHPTSNINVQTNLFWNRSFCIEGSVTIIRAKPWSKVNDPLSYSEIINSYVVSKS